MELDVCYQSRLLSGEFTDGNGTYIITRPHAVGVNPKHGYWHIHSRLPLHTQTQTEALACWLTQKADVLSLNLEKHFSYLPK